MRRQGYVEDACVVGIVREALPVHQQAL